jgi:hypothetical protein
MSVLRVEEDPDRVVGGVELEEDSGGARGG